MLILNFIDRQALWFMQDLAIELLGESLNNK